MGRGGTAVTREASDMILADDNFASIVAAIREGRGIFDNIRKSLLYLLSGNTGELALMLVARLPDHAALAADRGRRGPVGAGARLAARAGEAVPARVSGAFAIARPLHYVGANPH